MPNPLDPPDSLDSDRRQIWLAALQEIMEAGTLQRLNPPSLSAYVEAVYVHQRATTMIQQSDVLLEHDGRPIANPALKVQEAAARIIAQFARQFRLTAAAPGQQHDDEQKDDTPAEHRAAPVELVRAGDDKRGRWCEQHHRTECTEQRKRGAGPCHQIALRSTGRCRMHDGRRKAVVVAEQLGLTYGTPIKVSPEQALLEELWRTAGHVRWLGDRVAALEATALTWGTDRQVERWWGEFPGSEVVRRAGPHVLLDLYDRERKHLVHVSTAIIGAGLAAKMVDAAQELGQAFARATDAILRDLSLSDEQWSLVPEVVPRRLRELIGA